ncbi:MAG TPA: FMN-binding negative transcriptional regulator [Anaerolineales bacterium]|jgi:transcriptional regulator|nr:FMN-binding negative transcriptional regulator [Anaerolineales bacterium]
MYISHYYREEDLSKIADFVREHDFATLVVTENGLPVASHLLVDFATDSEGTWLISGHMARANKLWRALDSEKEVLLIFGGPNTYISPTWYSHLNVPTWNYIAVHLYGLPRLIESGPELADILSRLVKRYETKSDYRLESLPPDFVQKEMRGVMGFQVKVTHLEANFKLSQNRNDEDYANVVRQLEARGDEQSTAIASEMKKNRKV